MSKPPIPPSRMGGLFSSKKGAPDSAVITHESRDESLGKEGLEASGVTSHESTIVSHESGIMNPEQTAPESRVMSQESAVMNQESGVVKPGPGTPESGVLSPESSVVSHESGVMKIDLSTLNSAVSQGRKDPRISAYSPLVMGVLRYMRKTTPEFSMSDVDSTLLENAIREKYPELSKRVEKALAEKG